MSDCFVGLQVQTNREEGVILVHQQGYIEKIMIQEDLHRESSLQSMDHLSVGHPNYKVLLPSHQMKQSIYQHLKQQMNVIGQDNYCRIFFILNQRQPRSQLIIYYVVNPKYYHRTKHIEV